MCRRTLLVAPVILLLASAAFAYQAVLSPVRKAQLGRAEGLGGPGASLRPNPMHQVASKPESPPVALDWGAVWQYYDVEEDELGNGGYRNVAGALEFVNDIYEAVVVKEVEYHLAESNPPSSPLGGHVWEDDGTGKPKWEDPEHWVAHRDFDLYDFPTHEDFWYVLPTPSRPFARGERFWVGFQIKYWDYSAFQGWNWDPAWDGKSWWWNTITWYPCFEQQGAAFSGCWTNAVLVEWEAYDHDAACKEIIAPNEENLVFIGETIAPQAEVINVGNVTHSFDVTMTIEPGGYSSTRTTDTLGTGETQVLTFDDWTVGEACGVEYAVEVCTQLPGDQFPNNDCCEKQVIAASLLLDFEQDDGLWESDPTGAWQWGVPLSPPGAHSGLNAWATNLTSDYDNSACWKLRAWEMWVKDSPRHAFAYWHQYDTQCDHDGYNVKLSTDRGNTWELLYPDTAWGVGYHTTADSANACIPNERCFSGQSGWHFVYFDLTGLVSPDDTILARFDFGSDAWGQGPGVVIDDFYGVCVEPVILGPSEALVTGGGWIPSNGPGNKRTFGFNAHSEDEAVWGQLQFNDHGTGMRVHSDTIKTLDIYGDTVANFSGDCRVDGVSGYSFACEAEDRGEPGHGVDRFSIGIYDADGNLYYSAGDFLGGGNIQIHTPDNGTAKGRHHPKTEQPGEISFTGPGFCQNSPNPFTQRTTISFHLPASGHTTLEIYDMTGRLVATLVDGKLNAGVHTAAWNTGDAPSGIYFYQLVFGECKTTGKLVVLR